MVVKYECDLVVIGSGAAGMTTAAVAATEGLDVLVLERRCQKKIVIDFKLA